MCIKEILLNKSSAKALMISIGKNKQDFIGNKNKTLALLVLLIGIKVTAMNF